ncbi:MAG: hypothetical protein KME64_29585 [Scytonematopsis contorta HA4267-MV1]|jgi:hypothetical protein|nr:hypothetical protein [Scytonematopsis contorta HA4267-MV1]
MSTSWQTTGKINPQVLTESRLQMHYAIQFIAATGAALAEPLTDYSHTSLEWYPELEVFVGALIRANKNFRLGLEPVSLTSIILSKEGDTIATLPLHQQTMLEALNWHKQEIAKLGIDTSEISLLDYPKDDFPDYKVAHGSVFNTNKQESERQELINYYANTQQILQSIAAVTDSASAIHIWPHHFDIATLITLAGMKNGEPRTIGIGMSPGDTSYNEPYWYVSGYPYPEITNLPELEGGFWHTKQWVGAVLTASLLSPEADVQRKQITAFLNSAFQASKNLLQV